MLSSILGSGRQSYAAVVVDADDGFGVVSNPVSAKPESFDVIGDKKDVFGNDRNEDGIHYSHLTKIKDGTKGASMASCFFTLANTIMGSGMLGLPYAFSRTGWVLGSMLVLFSATSSAFALHLLSCCALRLPYPSSFYNVAGTALPNFEKIIDLAVMIKCFGVATSYLIVIGGLMPDVIVELYGSSSNSSASRRFWESRLVWVSLGFMIVTPLSFFKQLQTLKYTSFLSICFIVFLMVLIVLFSTQLHGFNPCAHDDDNPTAICIGEKANFNANFESLQVLSIFVFGFTCHQNMFSIVNELHAVSQARLDAVIVASIAAAFTIYMIVAAAGFSTFGDNVESNILQSYPSERAHPSPRLASPALLDCDCTSCLLACCRDSCGGSR
jgi:amino acid permease